MRKYDHKKIEKKWQKKWEKDRTFEVKEDPDKKKYYALVEFPYPSGAGLHVGHPRSYTALDIVARKKRMEGYNVLYPMGWDAFGLPTENFAIKTGRPPEEVTKENIKNFTRQLKSLGFSFDWSREVDTTDPEYYKWTQWLFLQFFKHGLAYKKAMPINWCPKDKIGLANEEVVDGKCERCGTPVERRHKEQWMLAITKYADKLLAGLKDVDYAPQIKIQQENWIGRSEGAEVLFPLTGKYNYVFLHGFGGSADGVFFPWLKKTLEEAGHTVWVKNLPNTDDPSEEEQIDFVLKNAKFDENTIVVGHSLGCVVAMKVLEKINKKIAGLVMAGGFVEPNFKDNDRIFANKFIWNFDFEKIKKNSGFIKILSSLNDYAVPLEQGKILAEKLGGELAEVISADEHFCGAVEPSLLEKSLPSLKVYTTRPDTLFGATYMVVAPEHELIKNFESNLKNSAEVKKYIEAAGNKSDLERTDLAKDKTGVELKGLKAINPVNGIELPIFVADYVLTGYGTGAIMAVPGHDQRDWEFAKKYNLPIKQVVAPFFSTNEGTAALHPDKKTVKRYTVYSFVKHSKKDEYLCLDWEKFGWHSGIIGGVDQGEDPIEAAKREIREETGYKNIRLIRDVGVETHNNFYAAHKNENRYAFGPTFLFELIDEEQEPTSADHTKNHRAVWIKQKEMPAFLNLQNFVYLWKVLQGQESACFAGDGVAINSEFLNEFETAKAKNKIIAWLEEKGLGKKQVQYKLRDWVFSRQRYWGEPIPLVHCDKCGWVPLPEKDLPLKLPKVKKYEPTDTGESPLSTMEKWVKTKCPQCGAPARRETDTMPNWAGSSWYFLRYCDPKNKEQFASPEKLKYWMPVDWYNGGMEHVVLHLLYSRFWNIFLYDLGLVPFSEPYKKRTAHGLILAKGGEKMSKSKGNVVNPDEIVQEYGADTLRTYIMFMGPFDQAVEWDTNGLIGVGRFLERVWALQEKLDKKAEENKKLIARLHQTIKKVTEDIEAMHFNTAVAKMMELVNEMTKEAKLFPAHYSLFLKLLSPFAPHICEEIWENLGLKGSVSLEAWPKYDPALAKDENIILVVQVNGKVRENLEVPAEISEEQAKKMALQSEAVKKWLIGHAPKKVIYVKGRLISIVM